MNFGAIISAIGNSKERELDLAIRRGDIDVVKELIIAGVNVNKKNYYGSTALIVASSRGHINIARELIIAGANVNEKNSKADTALMLAKNGKVDSLTDALIDANEADEHYLDNKRELNWNKKWTKNIAPVASVILAFISSHNNSITRITINQIIDLINKGAYINTKNDDAWIAARNVVSKIETEPLIRGIQCMQELDPIQKKKIERRIEEAEELKNSFGYALLAKTIRERYDAIVKILKEAGAKK